MHLNIFEKDLFKNFSHITEINTYIIVFAILLLVHLPGYSFNYNLLYIMGGITVLVNILLHHFLNIYIEDIYMNPLESFIHVIFITILITLTGGINSPFHLFLFLPLVDSIGSKKVLHNIIILILIELIYIGFLITNMTPIHLVQTVLLILVSVMLDVRVILTRIMMLNASNLAMKHEAKVEELTELNKYKDEFVNITTHELRTPVTILKGYIDLLMHDKDTSFSNKGHEIMENLVDQSKELGELVEELLDISRIETGKITINNTSFSLVKLVEETIEGLQIQAEKNKISLRFVNKLDKDLDINSDRDRLREILINLIDNAIKYSIQGGIVTVYVRMVDKSLEVSVKDNGIGIPAEDQLHIFQKFFRAKNVYRLACKGTGLGLYIVYRLVDRLKGYIQFTSEENKGTTFRVMFPLS